VNPLKILGKVYRFLEDLYLALLLGIVFLIIGGCATQPEVRVTKVPEPPVIVVPEKPTIPAGSKPDDVVRAIRLYILSLEEALEEAITALNVYRQKP